MEKMLHRLMISVELNVEFGGNNKRFNVRLSPTVSQSAFCICTWEADIFGAPLRSEIRFCMKGPKKEKPGLMSRITTGSGCAHRHTLATSTTGMLGGEQE